MSINIKIKEKPDLKKMEISELISYMENDYNFKTSYSYEELKETADYLRELAVQWHPDAMYAYSTLYNNVYDMPRNGNKELMAWKKDIKKNEWYGKAIFAYDTMNTSDPEILVRIAVAFLNRFLGDDTDVEYGMKICKDLLNLSDNFIRIDITDTTQYKLCVELRKYYRSVAEKLYYEENIEEIEERRDNYYDEYDTYLYDEEDEEKADKAYEAYEAAEREYDESEYNYYVERAECVICDLDNLCSNEEANITPEIQCIHGARTFHSARYNHAAKWYLKSAERGYAPAMCYYAKCLSKGIGGAEKNVAEAEMWLIKAIESGLNYALLWLGDFYLENSKIYSNAVEDALECYELAAECGVYDAYKKLYKCYAGETKYPFEKNEEKADEYLKLSQHEEKLKLPYRIISAIHYGSDVDGVFNLHRLF